jgi:F-type H+-transporting ATPase subunit gamma
MGARMTAMEYATENANTLISELQMQFNKKRQEGITKEILEIISGSEALKV